LLNTTLDGLHAVFLMFVRISLKQAWSACCTTYAGGLYLRKYTVGYCRNVWFILSVTNAYSFPTCSELCCWSSWLSVSWRSSSRQTCNAESWKSFRRRRSCITATTTTCATSSTGRNTRSVTLLDVTGQHSWITTSGDSTLLGVGHLSRSRAAHGQKF